MMINYPKLIPLKNFTYSTDMYICAMGFEDRSLISNENLAHNNFKTKHTLCIKYNEYENENEFHKNDLEKIWNVFSNNFEYIDYDRKNRINETNKLYKKLESLKNNTNSITINISSLHTYLQIWILNYAFNNYNKIHIIYTQAKEYADQTQRDSYTSGIDEIFTMSEFSGAFLPGYSSLLIAFLGYDFNRANSIDEHVESFKKIGILPSEMLNSESGKILCDKHKYNFNDGESLSYISIFDFEKMIHELEKIRIKNIENSNITIALNGSKLHSLFALLFVKKYQDIQLLMSSPLFYHPRRFSFGSINTFELILDKHWLKNFCNPSLSYDFNPK